MKKTNKRKITKRASIAQLIEQRSGSVAQFARDLSRLSGQKVKWGRVNNWKVRNRVSRSMVVHFHKLTGAPFTDLLR